MIFDFQELSKCWPSAIVARSEVPKFTGGLVNARSLANLDCLGQGPPRGRLGRKVFYRVADLVKWLSDRAAHSEGVK